MLYSNQAMCVLYLSHHIHNICLISVVYCYVEVFVGYLEHSAAILVRKRFLRLLLLVAAWIFGCICGTMTVSETVFSSLMRSGSSARTSIVGFMVTLSVPFILSYILYRFFGFYLILPIVFIKAFSYAYCYCGFRLTFGDAAWLVGGLSMFADSLSVFLLMWFWLKLSGGKINLTNYLLGCLCILLAMGCIDYVCVAPLLGTY